MIRQIQDLLIDAVRLDRETHEHVGPRALRAQQLPYEHDYADRVGWGRVPHDKLCQLAPEDGDPHKQAGRDFWDQYNRDPDASEISRAERVLSWVNAVDKPEERRALLAWATSKVGGKAFRRWCFAIEGISQTTGLKRKDRALVKIREHLACRIGQHDETLPEAGLLRAGQIGDVSATIAAGADEGEGLNHWRSAETSLPASANYLNARTGDRRLDVPASAFSWAAKRNERRRRQAEKRKAAKEKAVA